MAPRRRSHGGRPGLHSSRLTSRELAVLALLADGCDNQQIADELVMNLHSVENRIGDIYTKLGIMRGNKGYGGRRVQATLIYQRTEMLHRGVGPALKFGEAIHKLREAYKHLAEAQAEFDAALVVFRASDALEEEAPDAGNN